MNLKEQEYICTVARCGSITQAAKQLFITQPALSSYISNVEKALGVELFSHEGKQIRLTYAGEQYVEKAEQMLAMRQEYLREVQDIQRGLRGRVCVGMQRRRGPVLAVRPRGLRRKFGRRNARSGKGIVRNCPFKVRPAKGGPPPLPPKRFAVA